MSVDINAYNYPYVTKYMEEDVDPEAHSEPAGEDLKTSVEGMEHPLFSPTGLKETINLYRSLGNSPLDKLIEGEITEQVLKDLVQIAFNKKFPFELLVFAVDYIQKLDERSSASDASGIADKLHSFATELVGTLGRQPLNSEVLAAFLLNSTSAVKDLLEKAQTKPDEESQPIGSEHDDKIFYKPKFGEQTLRTNKEAYKYFNKRTILGDDVFAYLPLGENTNV